VPKRFLPCIVAAAQEAAELQELESKGPSGFPNGPEFEFAGASLHAVGNGM
jgi:hypothetical protein